MAEGLARHRFGASVRVQSAGSQPSQVNPFAIRALEATGISSQGHSSKNVDTIESDSVDLVITLCAEELCPVFLGNARRMNWAMPDPDRKSEVLTDEERLAHFEATRDAIAQRIEVLASLRDSPPALQPVEFHTSIRVPNLALAARFYSWLLGVEPKEWTHRSVTFVSESLRTNFVLLVDDGQTLHQDTLCQLRVELTDKGAVIDAHKTAVLAGWTLHKPAQTTWRGMPQHELWLKDPGGNLVEVYARLTNAEVSQAPPNYEPAVWVGG
jgi:protein-tyrosine-phosphatase/catechol 2,3-dioxygenase-like lactoylglutathione lyase family enzyme